MADFEVLKDYGVVADHDGVQLKLQLVSWYGNKPKYDLRPWKGDYGMKGMVFEEDSLKGLQKVLKTYFTTHPYVPKEVESKVVHSLTSLPAGDINFQTALREATKEDLKQAIAQMEGQPGNKTRILLCERALEKTGKRGRPKKEVSTSAKGDAVENTPPVKKDNIIKFPTAKPEIIPLDKSDDTHTYEECEQKLQKEREIFKDHDSAYVIDGILELCKVDADFRNNVMRDDKNYAGAFKYFADKAREGYSVQYGGVAFLDNNLALGLAIDYFNADSEKMEEEAKKKREEEMAKRKAEIAKTTASKKKRGRPRKKGA